MKLTESHLRSIIRQELEAVLKEGFFSDLFGGKKKTTPKPTTSQPAYDPLDALKAKNDADYARRAAAERDAENIAWDKQQAAEKKKREEEERERQMDTYRANQGTVRRHFYQQ